jgi:hypothetical protein
MKESFVDLMIPQHQKERKGGGENQNQTTETRRKPEETRRTRRIDRAAGGGWARRPRWAKRTKEKKTINPIALR